MYRKLYKKVFCEDCGKIIDNKDYYYIDDYPYCCRCYYKNKYYKGIHDYDYNPKPVFHGEGNVFLKVEIGVDKGGYLDVNAEKILDVANNEHEERLYIRHNDKLKNGFVLVSHPMTLDYHIKIMPWKDIIDKLIEMGYECYENKTCKMYGYISDKISALNYNIVKYSEFKGTLKYDDFIVILQKAYENFIKVYY